MLSDTPPWEEGARPAAPRFDAEARFAFPDEDFAFYLDVTKSSWPGREPAWYDARLASDAQELPIHFLFHASERAALEALAELDPKRWCYVWSGGLWVLLHRFGVRALPGVIRYAGAVPKVGAEVLARVDHTDVAEVMVWWLAVGGRSALEAWRWRRAHPATFARGALPLLFAEKPRDRAAGAAALRLVDEDAIAGALGELAAGPTREAAEAWLEAGRPIERAGKAKPPKWAPAAPEEALRAAPGDPGLAALPVDALAAAAEGWAGDGKARAPGLWAPAALLVADRDRFVEAVAAWGAARNKNAVKLSLELAEAMGNDAALRALEPLLKGPYKRMVRERRAALAG